MRLTLTTIHNFITGVTLIIFTDLAHLQREKLIQGHGSVEVLLEFCLNSTQKYWLSECMKEGMKAGIPFVFTITAGVGG